MKIVEWYASDVAQGTQGDSVGAAGFAGKTRPLAMALLRLFVGDNHAAKDIVALMAQMVISKAYRAGIVMQPTTGEDIAKAVLAWHRDGTCKPCGGHGYMRFDGSPGLSDQECRHCRGTKKVPFERQFSAGHIDFARWLVAEIEREQAIAGREAMRRLAPRLDL